MNNYIVTGFDEAYWERWGASWLISLKEIANYNGEVIVVGFNLSQSTKNKLLEHKVNCIQGVYSGNYRNDIFKCIAEFAKTNCGKFVYWDADVYFQENIDDIFDLIHDDFLITANVGFLAGSSGRWTKILDIYSMFLLAKSNDDIFQCLVKHFSNFIFKIENCWNFADIPNLKDLNKKLVIKDKIQKVIHPCGSVKNVLDGRNILFWEREKDLYRQFFEKKTSRKLVFNKKSVVNNNI
jgi:hypothetical protein